MKCIIRLPSKRNAINNAHHSFRSLLALSLCCAFFTIQPAGIWLGNAFQMQLEDNNSLILAQAQSQPTWYGNADNITNTISFLALLVSGVTAVYTLSSQSAQEIREKKEELRDIIVSLSDSREKFQEKSQTITDQQIQEATGISFNSRQQLYLAAAEALIVKIPKHVSWVEYWYLANEYWFAGDYKKSEVYYRRSLKKSSRTIPVYHATALRTLGGIYYSPGVMQNISEGKKLYEKAISILKESRDPYTQYALAFTFEKWGFLEIGIDSAETGKRYIEMARQNYEKLPNAYWLKHQALNILDNKLSSALSGVAWRFFRSDPRRLEEGRIYYLESIQLIKHKLDSSSILALGYIYESWGYSEFLNFHDQKGREYTEAARKIYETLPVDFQQRAVALERLSISEIHARNARSQNNF